MPTTAGTGAETESTATVTDLAQGIKGCVWHRRQKPRAALLDPELTFGLPPRLTAWTGCDALVHAIEAYCVPDFHPLCDGAALEALRLIVPNLKRAVADGWDLEARGAMLVGSCLAGIAFLKGLGLVHAMSHMAGAVHDTHHGLTNAVLLPPVLRFNEAALAGRLAPMAQAMGLRGAMGMPPVDGRGADFEGFYGAVVALLNRLEIPRGLAEIGVTAESLPEIAEKAHGDAACATNPRPASVAEIAALLQESQTAAR